MKFQETSAKTNANVEQMVQEIANSIIEKGLINAQKDHTRRPHSNTLTHQNKNQHHSIRLGSEKEN